MSADQIHHERRASQRFDYQLPVGVRLAGTDREGYGFTQNLSGRGVFFYTDFPVAEGDAVELTLVMPSEITLTENARVCCRAKVVRVLPVDQKFGVAARLEGYEYLPKAETAAQVSANFPRISSSHGVPSTERNPPLANSVVAGSDLSVVGAAATGAVVNESGSEGLGNG